MGIRHSYIPTQYRRSRGLFVAVLSALLISAVNPPEVGATLQDSVYVVTFEKNEAVGSKLAKAAHVRPSAAQIRWMERERNVFLHYNMNTFHGADWGSGSENPKDFAPTAQDPDQWAKVIKDAKFSMAVPTAKHHDGFCIWNTATTSHSIKNAMDTTDVIGALQKGCDNHGVDLGIYLSPWDMNQGAKGLWPTDAYNTFFVNQLRELLGGKYGPIGELWFDGACGGSGCSAIFQPLPNYRPDVWYDTIEALQPMAVIRLYDGFYFADANRWTGIQNGTQKLQWRGKEIRWCGNEGGTGRPDEWSVQPVVNRFFGADQQSPDLGEESYYKDAIGAVWYQSEVNTSIANGSTPWFWHSNSYSLKSLNDMKTLYYNSIGNNSNLLLNLLPDNSGRIPNDQINLLRRWNNWIDSTFTMNLAKGAKATAVALNAFAEAEGHEADKIIDNKRHTYWSPEGLWNMGTSTAAITFELPAAQTFDHVMIKEYVYNGQRIADWNVEYYDEGSSSWKSLVNGKKVIGYRRICKFNQVTASRVRLNISRSWDTPEISDFALYRTLSGIDTIPEDTSRGVVKVIPALRESGGTVSPKIGVRAGRLTIAAMGHGISKVTIVRIDGRSVVKESVQNAQHYERSLMPGVYLVTVTGKEMRHSEKVAILR